MRDRFLYSILSFVIFFLWFPLGYLRAEAPVIHIAETFGPIEGEAVSGDIMSLMTEGRLTRAVSTGDERMYGVMVADPVVVYTTDGTMPVVRTGNAKVNVTTLGGPIGVGDYVTSSQSPGKGQKSVDLSGYVLGIALEPFGEEAGESTTIDGKQVRAGQITVAVGIGPASPVQVKATGGIFGTIRQYSLAILRNIGTSRQAERLIRMILAALIAIIIIFISYRTFGRNVTKGIEAIGRNPLAKASIQMMIIINVVLLIISCIVGLILSLVIISA